MSLRDKIKCLQSDRRRRRARRHLERSWSKTGSGQPATVPVRSR